MKTMNQMSQAIVCIHVGQCGNRMGMEFWDQLRKEHGLDTSGKFIAKDKQLDAIRRARLEVFFREVGEDRYVPRALLVDLEPGTMDDIKASPIGSLFKPDNFIFGASGAGNNWAKGHYTEGAELIDEVMDCVRRESEAAEKLQGYLLFHSLGGGTGSGLGTLILSKLENDYPERVRATVSVFPSPKVSDVLVEPYNATLSIHQLLANADLVFAIDNEALFNISHNVLKQAQPNYRELNQIAVQALLGATAPWRLPSAAFADMRSMTLNLVPRPGLHFLELAEAPLLAPGTKPGFKVSLAEVGDQVWHSRNSLVNVSEGKYMAAMVSYRADANLDIHDTAAQLEAKFSGDFVEWMPNCNLSMLTPPAPERASISATRVANTTQLGGLFQRIAAQFASLYKRKAFLHWYQGEGMDEMEFQEADKSVRDLITEYQRCEEGTSADPSGELEGAQASDAEEEEA